MQSHRVNVALFNTAQNMRQARLVIIISTNPNIEYHQTNIKHHLWTIIDEERLFAQ
jgi:hypothetical protein